MTHESYEAFVGPRNGIYYLGKFDSIERRGGGARATWNWPAFLFNAVWALYRKLYSWFFAFWGIVFVASIVEKTGSPGISALIILASMALFGLYANALYYGRAKRAVAEASAAVDEPLKRIEYLRAKGGVHLWVPWVFGSIPAVGVLAAVLLPLYQDRTVAKRALSWDDLTVSAPNATLLPPEDKEKLSGRATIVSGEILTGNVYNGTSDWTVTEIIVNVSEPNWFVRAVEANEKGIPAPRLEKYRVPVYVPPFTNREFSVSVNWRANEKIEWNIYEARGVRQ